MSLHWLLSFTPRGFYNISGTVHFPAFALSSLDFRLCHLPEDAHQIHFMAFSGAHLLAFSSVWCSVWQQTFQSYKESIIQYFIRVRDAERRLCALLAADR